MVWMEEEGNKIRKSILAIYASVFTEQVLIRDGGVENALCRSMMSMWLRRRLGTVI